MRDCLKFLLAVGVGAAVALVIALPIVLVNNDDDSDQGCPGPRFFWFNKIICRNGKM